MVKRSRTVVLALTTAVAVFLWNRHTSEQPSAPEVRPHDVSPLPAASLPHPAIAAPKTEAVSASASAQVHAASKQQMVDRLSKTNNPGDAFEAYELLRLCVDATRAELGKAERAAAGVKDQFPPAREACGDLTPDQIVSRGQLLQRAAEAGIHGAAAAFADEGPGGFGYGTPRQPGDAEDAAFQRAMSEYIEIGAQHEDLWSLRTMVGKSEMPINGVPNYAAALRYLDQANAASMKQTGSDLRTYASEKARLEYLLKQQQKRP